MQAKTTHECRAGKWEFNPVELFYTKRCVMCGDILTRISHTKALTSSDATIKRHANHVLTQTKMGGKAGG